MSNHDPANTGRPVRLTLYHSAKDGYPMIVDEIGGYYAPLDEPLPEPMGTVSRTRIRKSSKRPSVAKPE